MRRRDVLGVAAAGLASAQSTDHELLKPKALVKGDTVGLITPSTFVSDPDRLETVARTLRYFELTPKWGRNVVKKEGYLGGSIEQRVDDLHEMFSDSSVKAVFCVRGGYGSPHSA